MDNKIFIAAFIGAIFGVISFLLATIIIPNMIDSHKRERNTIWYLSNNRMPIHKTCKINREDGTIVSFHYLKFDTLSDLISYDSNWIMDHELVFAFVKDVEEYYIFVDKDKCFTRFTLMDQEEFSDYLKGLQKHD